MKKLNVYATVANINGKKSSGCEDNGGYSHWKVVGVNPGSSQAVD